MRSGSETTSRIRWKLSEPSFNNHKFRFPASGNRIVIDPDATADGVTNVFGPPQTSADQRTVEIQVRQPYANVWSYSIYLQYMSNGNLVHCPQALDPLIVSRD